MSDETKTPQAKQWWVNSSGKIRYIIGVKLRGSIVYEDSTGWSFANDNSDWNDWHHEPRCTGFDWTEPPAIDPGEGWELLPVGTMLQEGDEFESGGDWNKTCYPGTKNIKGWTYRRRKPPAETWPKWYRWDVDTTGFVFRRMENGAVFTHQLGFPAIQSDDWSVSLAGAFSIGGLIEISEAEAIARLKPAEPVTADRVPDHRPAREVIMDIVSWLDEKDGEIASPCMALETAQQWLDDNPEEPAPFAKPFNDPRSGMGIRKDHVSWRPNSGQYDAATDVTYHAETPVESPDDWVDLPDTHILRADIDEVSETGDCWWPVMLSEALMLGESGWSKARCRRRDLPAPQPKTMDVSPGEGWRWVEKDEPWQEGDDCLICDFKHPHTHNCQCWRRRIVPQPKRTPVRLFVSADVRWGDRYIVSVKDGNPNPERHQEIKFDGSRFYVEGIE